MRVSVVGGEEDKCDPRATDCVQEHRLHDAAPLVPVDIVVAVDLGQFKGMEEVGYEFPPCNPTPEAHEDVVLPLRGARNRRRRWVRGSSHGESLCLKMNSFREWIKTWTEKGFDVVGKWLLF